MVHIIAAYLSLVVLRWSTSRIRSLASIRSLRSCDSIRSLSFGSSNGPEMVGLACFIKVFYPQDTKAMTSKFGPSSSPDMFSTEVQLLAKKLMPEAMQQEILMRIEDLKAIRISNIIRENIDEFS